MGFRQGIIRGGKRETTARAFLRPALGRGNVTLYTEALVLRVIVEGGRAVGVVYEREGQQHEVRAPREVILSAGTLQTPQLLLLSGIGPAANCRPSASSRCTICRASAAICTIIWPARC